MYVFIENFSLYKEGSLDQDKSSSYSWVHSYILRRQVYGMNGYQDTNGRFFFRSYKLPSIDFDQGYSTRLEISLRLVSNLIRDCLFSHKSRDILSCMQMFIPKYFSFKATVTRISFLICFPVCLPGIHIDNSVLVNFSSAVWVQL